MTGPFFEELEIVLISLLLKQEHRKNRVDAFSVSLIHSYNYSKTAKSELTAKEREADFRNKVWIKRDSLKFIIVKSFGVNPPSFPLMN